MEMGLETEWHMCISAAEAAGGPSHTKSINNIRNMEIWQPKYLISG